MVAENVPRLVYKAVNVPRERGEDQR